MQLLSVLTFIDFFFLLEAKNSCWNHFTGSISLLYVATSCRTMFLCFYCTVTMNDIAKRTKRKSFKWIILLIERVVFYVSVHWPRCEPRENNTSWSLSWQLIDARNERSFLSFARGFMKNRLRKWIMKERLVKKKKVKLNNF